MFRSAEISLVGARGVVLSLLQVYVTFAVELLVFVENSLLPAVESRLFCLV